MPEFN